MKKTLLSLIYLSVIPNCYSQVKGQIGVSYGMSIPYKQFASTEDDLLGYARTGSTVNINYTRKVHQLVRLHYDFYFISNPVDEALIKGEIQSSFPDGTKITYRADPYKELVFQFGLGTEWPIISEKLYINCKATAGLAKSKLGDILETVQGIENNYDYTISYRRRALKNSSGLAFCLASSLRFPISKMVNAQIQYTYFATRADYKEVQAETWGSTSRPSYYVPYRSTITSLGHRISVGIFSVGISCNLYKKNRGLRSNAQKTTGS